MGCGARWELRLEVKSARFPNSPWLCRITTFKRRQYSCRRFFVVPLPRLALPTITPICEDMQAPLRKTVRLVVLICVNPLLSVGMSIASGCKWSPHSPPALTAVELFRLHCSTCHGDGSGNGHIAGTLKVRPRNLKHQQWQQSVSDAHILQVMRDGGAAVKLSADMPAFGNKLSPAELQSLVLYLRALGR